jgi:hypothetical protein
MSIRIGHPSACFAAAFAVVALAACPLAAQDAARPASLPLNKVVMFNSGVGYFEHRGDVDGDTHVEFSFRTSDINDLLKSMVLEDRGGGTISTVTYGSRDPITKTLKTFPVDLTENPSLGQLLDQVRGERVQVEAPNAITGVLVGVERRERQVGKDHDLIEVEFLNLLTDEGLRSVPMESVSRIKLLNETLDGELRKALQVLARGHNTDKKTVSLNLEGKGKRPVRVAYIQETPVWKTSYRLVLGEKDAPFLQGWAIVENTTEDDWNNVALTLVSGRPISYRMDLYEPLYAQRPLEQMQLFAALRPQVYSQDLSQIEALQLKVAANAPGQVRGDLAKLRDKKSGARMGGGMGGEGPVPAAAPAMAESHLEADNFAFRSAAGTSAQAGDVGELFQYVIASPVTLARQKSAMLPIVNESVKGEKVSIYNESVQAKHPLNGLRLVNSTSLHLMQGPVTVFDGGAYAGDAKIEDLAPGAERLISYALDLKTEVAPESRGGVDQLVGVKLVKGTLEVSRKLTRSRKYTIKNSDAKPRTVLIEHPYDASWKLVAPEKPAEKTRDRYRFAVTAEPGKPTVLDVNEEQMIGQQLVLSNLDESAIGFYISQREVSPAVKAALQEVVKRKIALNQVTQERDRLVQQISAISEEQNRIRQNMGQLDRNTDLYKRYVQKFGAQEDQVEKMRDQIQKLTTDEARLRKALDDFLVNLEVA